MLQPMIQHVAPTLAGSTGGTDPRTGADAC
jgi:hypothetical protein